MFKYYQAEMLKQKRSFNKVLLWLAPLITVLIALVLMNGNYLQTGAYNWWYILLLPGGLSMFSAFVVTKERRKNRHGLFGVVVNKKKLWLAQIFVCAHFLFVTCLFFFGFITIAGMVFGQEISILESFIASVMLFITFAWQIPLWMYVSERLGAFIAIIFSLVCNFVIAVICAVESFWWIPFAIPARLMCACIRVLPNGLPIEIGNELADKGVILPGVLIATGLFIVLTWFTKACFEKCEV